MARLGHAWIASLLSAGLVWVCVWLIMWIDPEPTLRGLVRAQGAALLISWPLYGFMPRFIAGRSAG
jgi:hypothetical protein